MSGNEKPSPVMPLGDRIRNLFRKQPAPSSLIRQALQVAEGDSAPDESFIASIQQLLPVLMQSGQEEAGITLMILLNTLKRVKGRRNASRMV